ncbi:MAG: tRNA (adenosine(37)-N6)-threonylcarbamoyltransferase complex dimerization subunit type 1 TsaB [Sedimentisphaerales bacterium]|nr:tRNA (adenosine(37)-N6)-threonylcarbamoyltransferase complex dimerization subunit type 1 TsaB [Sedimentisphaerales bacterium]
MADIYEQSVCLAIDTSGRFGSVALGMGDTILGGRDFSGIARQSAELSIAIQDLLRQAGKKANQVEHVYLAIGPGSFTGLRISATVAKMFAFCTGARLVCVSTMEVLAANGDRFIAETGTKVARIGTILDAKRGQFYVAAFQDSPVGWIRLMEDSLAGPEVFMERVKALLEPIWLLGEGLVFYKDRFDGPLVRFLPESYWTPSAGEVYRIGRLRALRGLFSDPAALLPVYLRGPDAVELKDRPLGR